MRGVWLASLLLVACHRVPRGAASTPNDGTIASIAVAPHRESLDAEGLRRWRHGDEAGAIAAFTRAVEADPTDDVAALHLARSLRLTVLRSGTTANLDPALERILAMLADDASRLDVWGELVLLQIGRASIGQRGWLWQARWSLEHAQDLATELGADAATWASLENTAGILALAEGDMPAARRRFEAAIARDPSYAPAQLNLGVLAAYVGDDARAEVALDAGLRNGAFAGDPDATIALAHVRQRLGDLEGAERVLLALDDRVDPRIHFAIGRLQMDGIGPEAERTAGHFRVEPYRRARSAFEAYLAAPSRGPGNDALRIAASLRLDELDTWFRPHESSAPKMQWTAEQDAELRAFEAKEKQRLLRLEQALLHQEDR